MSAAAAAPRLLLLPGLNDSGPAHWQTWLEAQHRGARRLRQDDWREPDLERWLAALQRVLDAEPGARWIAVAHSFGSLALAHWLGQPQAAADGRIVAALLVAPAEPDKFGLAERLPRRPLPVPSTLVLSETDPWMSADSARRWAAHWGSRPLNLGDAGHVNAESGFGPWPFARRWVTTSAQRLQKRQRPVRAAFCEWSFAV